MTNIAKNFEFKSIQLQVVIDGERKSMSFQEIEDLVISKGKPRRYDMANKVGFYSSDFSIESFAQRFVTMFYTDYKEMTFKVNIEWYGAAFFEVPSLTKQDVFLLTSPVL